MTIGFPVTQDQVNQQLGNAAIQIRNACRQVERFHQWLNVFGATNLEALGFTPTEAASVIAKAGELNVIAEVFFGKSAAGIQNFDGDMAILYGGN